MDDRYKINIIWDYDKKIIGWYGTIHKDGNRWKLTPHFKTRGAAMLKALDMIQDDKSIR